jgi:4'-phosphopantetheinyl transferase EntD
LLARHRFAKRRRDWLNGRKALKPLLRRLQRRDDTAAIRFPDTQVSLSHGSGMAFAVATPANRYGIGIDYEALREVRPRVAEWFLCTDEIRWLQRQGEDVFNDHLIRLWTMKEAAFKCDPANRGRTLREYVLADPASQDADIISASAGKAIRVASRRYSAGYLSIAVCGDV